ncbi:hypothetical protein LRR81_17430 [Metabacillus sp. GX 13764]|uniref:hypothetical protein n=1 Tax=Metabacillus kandeliae TaxID=2900151 RepID=UPI001E32A4CD|nr:hypothetical protein [Metabacillus kandeliae]MCD7036025.1 hypothetical protein [Metabacillus kandeliae]
MKNANKLLLKIPATIISLLVLAAAIYYLFHATSTAEFKNGTYISNGKDLFSQAGYQIKLSHKNEWIIRQKDGQTASFSENDYNKKQLMEFKEHVDLTVKNEMDAIVGCLVQFLLLLNLFMYKPNLFKQSGSTAVVAGFAVWICLNALLSIHSASNESVKAEYTSRVLMK